VAASRRRAGFGAPRASLGAPSSSEFAAAAFSSSCRHRIVVAARGGLVEPSAQAGNCSACVVEPPTASVGKSLRRAGQSVRGTGEPLRRHR